MKQGAVISPILFAVYYDELIAKLAGRDMGAVSLSILSVHYRMQTIYSGTSSYGHLTSKVTSPLRSPFLSPKLYSTM